MSNVFEHLDIEYEELNKLGIVDITMVKGERGSSGDYEQLSHLPKINGVTVTGNKTAEDYGIDVIDDYEELSNLPKINNVTLTGNKTSNDLSLASQASMQNAELRLTVVENRIATIADPTDEQVAEAVDAWLDEHPEATTTVEDGAITFPKLASDVTDLFINETATTGNIVSFDDGAGGIPVKDLTVDITAVQDLHGYDHPWVGGAGKNKLIITGTTQTINGVTFTVNSDGTVKTSGTASDTTTFVVGTVKVTSGTAYFINGLPSDGSSTTFSMQLMRGDTVAEQILSAADVQYTASANETLSIRIVIRNGYNSNNLLFKPMVRLNTEADATFVPSANICPISGWDEVNVNVREINQWDEETELGGISASTGGNVTNTTTLRTKNYVSVIPNTRYYFNTGKFNTFIGYDESKNFVRAGMYVSAGDGGYYCDVPSDVYYIRWQFATTYGTTYNHDISFNYPSTDHDYHAYNGNTYTTDLNGTRYGGTLDVTTGVLTVTKFQYAFSGNETFLSNSAWGDYAYLYNTGVSLVSSVDAKRHNICSHLALNNQGSWVSLTPNHFMVAGGTYIGIGYDGTQAELKAWLTAQKNAGTPVQVVGLLVSPSTVQLTAKHVTTLLGQNNIWCDTGNITNLEYRADTKKYVDETIVDVPLAMIAPMETGTTASKAYAVGEYFILNGNQFCKAKTAIASGATFTLNTNYTVTTIGAELKALQ